MSTSEMKRIATKCWTVGDDARVRMAANSNADNVEEDEAVAIALFEKGKEVLEIWEARQDIKKDFPGSLKVERSALFLRQ